MWTEQHKRLDEHHITWINLIQSKTTDCAKMGFMTAQRSYTDTCTAQVTAPGFFGGFSFRGLKKLKGGNSWIHSAAQRKEHSKTEFGKKHSENEFGESETFTGANLVVRPARLTGVWRIRFRRIILQNRILNIVLNDKWNEFLKSIYL